MLSNLWKFSSMLTEGQGAETPNTGQAVMNPRSL